MDPNTGKEERKGILMHTFCFVFCCFYNVVVQSELKEGETGKRFLKIFMTECSLQLEVYGGTQAAPISTDVEQDGNA